MQSPPYRCQVWGAELRESRLCSHLLLDCKWCNPSKAPHDPGAEPGAGLAHDLARLGTWALAVRDSATGGWRYQEQMKVGRGAMEDGSGATSLPNVAT